LRSRLYSATSRPALLTYPRPPRRAPCGRDRHLVRGASAIGRDRLTTEERLSDIVEILAHGLLWLDVLRDYHGSIRSHNFRRFVTEGGRVVSACRLLRRDRILKGEKPADLPVQAPTNRAQHQDCQSTRLGSTAECVCPCRRGDRMKLLLHLLTSLHGTYQTKLAGQSMSALPGCFRHQLVLLSTGRRPLQSRGI
jgi:hypothetical protein